MRRLVTRTAGRSVPAASALVVLGRSLFPLTALVLIVGTLLWGPWVTLGLTALWWNVVTRIA